MRYARFAFETAKKLGVTRVHCGHKANIMKMTDGLFLERFKTIGKEFAGIETADVIVDAAVYEPGFEAAAVSG